MRQLGIDRIVDLQFGSGEAAYHVVLELYDRVRPPILSLSLSLFLSLSLSLFLSLFLSLSLSLCLSLSQSISLSLSLSLPLSLSLDYMAPQTRENLFVIIREHSNIN